MPRPITTASDTRIGRLVTPVTQRSLPERRGAAVPASASASASFAFRTLRGRPTIRPFMNPSMAGVRVTAMATAIATATDAAMPMVVRNGMPAKLRPMRAISTVMPAKTTADPAVPVARAADSSGDIPART